ncbi:MAG TPA: S9 family peptidase [Acidobacteriaceae bacterium]|nr:S9 family peptidase [Acidobacteriaceae bacterium]
MFCQRSLFASCGVSVLAFCLAASAQTTTSPGAPRLITPNDLASFHDVGSPEVSPDGQWVAYTVSTIDTKEDKRITDLWMVSWDGQHDVRLTWKGDVSDDSDPEDAESSSNPRWSPDGQYISFMADRSGHGKGAQVWIMDRRGGEAHQLTDIKDHLSSYAWSPDSKRLLLATTPAEPEEKDKEKKDEKEKEKPKPIQIDRYHFKQDIEGYLKDNERTHLYLWDIATKKLEKLTTDTKFDEENAVWSPDGSQIAFVSNHDADPDRSINNDVFVVDAKANSTPKQLTHYDGPDEGRIAWSPDGKSIAFLRGDPLKLWQYSENKLGIVAADGSSEARVLTAGFDRAVMGPVFSSDGKSIDVLAEDDRNQYIARVDVATGKVERVLPDTGTAMALNARGGHAALVWTTDQKPGEIYAFEDGKLRALTHHNDAFLAQLKLGETRDIQAVAKDGTQVHGLITLPPGTTAPSKQPMLLFIHGGPNGQDAHEWEVLRQLFAAHGYAVLNVNYRGSSGRGSAYQKAIAADWGHHEIDDLMATVDEAIKEGYADPDKMAVGGWSYGGILTDYTIASTNRFKAASSGAGVGNPVGLYGIDEYILQYDNELGQPWKDTQKYLQLGYPFFHADRIHTPTLYMGGTSDFNVPLNGGEQMYQALKSLNVPAELVVYPGQFHGFTRPSFIKDRYERWFAWYDKWVLGKTPPASTPASPPKS